MQHAPELPHPDPKHPIRVAQARLWLAAKEHLELVPQSRFSSASWWRERQQSTNTRTSIGTKPSARAGACQGRVCYRVNDPDRLLPPFRYYDPDRRFGLLLAR